MSSAELPESSSVAAIVTAREQLEAIRDEWLAPLVAQITDQAETIGRVTAERDQAQRERDDERQRREAVESRLSALEAQQAESLTQAIGAPEMATDAATDAPRKPRQRKWWLRLFGIDE